MESECNIIPKPVSKLLAGLAQASLPPFRSADLSSGIDFPLNIKLRRNFHPIKSMLLKQAILEPPIIILGYYIGWFSCSSILKTPACNHHLSCSRARYIYAVLSRSDHRSFGSYGELQCLQKWTIRFKETLSLAILTPLQLGSAIFWFNDRGALYALCQRLSKNSICIILARSLSCAIDENKTLFDLKILFSGRSKFHLTNLSIFSSDYYKIWNL